jgi:septal ring factor EnvC (AmiA/AmiB activator)
MEKKPTDTQEIPKELSEFAKSLYKAGKQIVELEFKLDKVTKQRDMLLQMLQKQMGL